MRKHMYHIIDAQCSDSWLSHTYNIFNIIIILLSLTPLMVKEPTPLLIRIDYVTVTIFVIDYFLHWLTADYNHEDKNQTEAFLTYPFTLLAIIDLVSILPSLTFFSYSWRLFRLVRLFRSLRIFRAFKFIRYSPSIRIFMKVLKNQKDTLILVVSLVLGYILVTSLLMFNIEPEAFPTYLEAVTWSVMSLTTTTFGETYPQTAIGQIIGNFSYLVGVAIIAVPTSVITASYTDELNQESKQNELKMKSKDPPDS